MSSKSKGKFGLRYYLSISVEWFMKILPSAVVVASALIGGIYLQRANNDTIQAELEVRKLKLQQEVLQELFSISDTVAQRKKLEDMITAGFLDDGTKKYSLMFYDTIFINHNDGEPYFEELPESITFDDSACDVSRWLPTHRKVFCNSTSGKNFKICINKKGYARFSYDISGSDLRFIRCTLKFADEKERTKFKIELPEVCIPASNTITPKTKTLVFMVHSNNIEKKFDSKTMHVNTAWQCD